MSAQGSTHDDRVPMTALTIDCRTGFSGSAQATEAIAEWPRESVATQNSLVSSWTVEEYRKAFTGYHRIHQFVAVLIDSRSSVMYDHRGVCRDIDIGKLNRR